MNITEYIDSKKIKSSEVKKNFKLIETIDVKEDKKGCYKCGRYVEHLLSESWCGAYFCSSCETLNMIYYQDMMGGGSVLYIIEIYKNKI